jgi:hypothetical protein
MQSCIPVEVLFINIVLFIYEGVVLECCIHLFEVATSTYFVEVWCIYDCFMELGTPLPFMTPHKRLIEEAVGVRINDIDDAARLHRSNRPWCSLLS